MIVLDTTVLVYAYGGDHPHRPASAAVLEGIAGGRVRATTTVEVIQEFAHVRSRRNQRVDVVQQARDLRTALSPLVSTDEADLVLGLEVYERTSRLGAFDSVLAAVAVRHGAALVSADTGFADVPQLAFADLATPRLVDRLAALDR